jgi:hypothetical protein
MQEFFVDAPCPLSIDVPGAVTKIRPGASDDRAEVELSVAGCSASDAEQLFDRLDLDARQVKGTIQVTSDLDRTTTEWWRWIRTFDGTLHVDVRCPSPVEADLTVPGGEIDMADLDGEFNLSVMGSPCHLVGLDGDIHLRGESSDVTLEDCSGTDILARVAVGSLTLTDVTAETLTLRSVAAPVSVTDCEGTTTITTRSAPVTVKGLEGPCTANSRGGPLHYEGCPTAETDLEVVGAPLTALLPPSCDAALTMTGPALTLDEAFSFEGERADEKIAGVLNDGGTALRLSGTGGTVECQSA